MAGLLTKVWMDLMGEIPHGTYGAYTNHKCRCDLCREAGRNYMSVYRKKPDNKSHKHNLAYGLRKQYAWQWIKENRPDVADEIRKKVNKEEQ